jgi:hypothetical protein
MVMVMLMLETMLRDPEMSGSLTSSLTSTNHHLEFHARAGAVTVHTMFTAVRVTFR